MLSGGRTLPLNTPLKDPTFALPMFEPSPWLAAVHSMPCAPGVPATPATLPAGHSIKLLACKPPKLCHMPSAKYQVFCICAILQCAHGLQDVTWSHSLTVGIAHAIPVS